VIKGGKDAAAFVVTLNEVKACSGSCPPRCAQGDNRFRLFFVRLFFRPPHFRPSFPPFPPLPSIGQAQQQAVLAARRLGNHLSKDDQRFHHGLALVAGRRDQPTHFNHRPARGQRPVPGGASLTGTQAPACHPHPPAEQAVSFENLLYADPGCLFRPLWRGERRHPRRALRPTAPDQREGDDDAPRGPQMTYETLRVLRFMKSMRMNCPRVMVFVKYALPLQIEATCLTKSTRLRSRANMKVLIMIPLRRQWATSR
jgi:hypothetical protein